VILLGTSSLETTDIFRGAFFLCMGGELIGIRFRQNGKPIASFHFTGPDLTEHDKAYRNGHALVNPVQLRESLNHLRDVMFEKLRNQEGRKRHHDDRSNDYRSGQAY
jgi:hypothetical protein